MQQLQNVFNFTIQIQIKDAYTTIKDEKNTQENYKNPVDPTFKPRENCSNK